MPAKSQQGRVGVSQWHELPAYEQLLRLVYYELARVFSMSSQPYDPSFVLNQCFSSKSFLLGNLLFAMQFFCGRYRSIYTF